MVDLQASVLTDVPEHVFDFPGALRIYLPVIRSRFPFERCEPAHVGRLTGHHIAWIDPLD